MNKIYDKLLLVLAVLALAGGVVFYMIAGSDVPSAQSVISSNMGDADYQALPRPESSEVEAVWPEAVEQAPGELFDVFTPPKIYINEVGAFVFEAPVGASVVKEIPFGVYLASIEQELYRIQLDGYIEEDLQDASKSLMLFYDEERGQNVRARIGQVKEDAGFKVLDFTIERTREPSGIINKTATATIEDLRTGKTVQLVHGEPLYNDSVTVVIRSKQDSSVEVILNKAGESFETPAGSYILQEINLEENSIKVEKQATEEQEARVETLNLQDTTSPPTTSQEAVTEPATETESTGFDFNF